MKGIAMRFKREFALVLLAAVMVSSAVGPAWAQGILLDHVDGLIEGEFIPENATLTFHMRTQGDATPHLMMNNGFKFSSSDITWTNLSGEFSTDYPSEEWFDFVRVINIWGGGPPEDTVLVGLLSLFGPGLPIDFDGILYTFTIGPLTGPYGAMLTLDSTWCPPSNPWMWDIVGENVAWGGPYAFFMAHCFPYTYCEPQPTILKDIEDILRVHIEFVPPDDIIWESVRVQSKIPPYEGYPVVEDGHLVTACFIMRFLGSSGFRPITGDFEATYTVEFDMTDGSHEVLTGDYSLKVYPGDVTFDARCDMNDIIFMADYFWRGGGVCKYFDEEAAEFMDIDNDGRVNPLDVRRVMELAGY